MPEEFLPPVVTRLEGDLGDLLAKLAEAKAAMAEFRKTTEEESKRSGKAAGEGLGGNLVEELKKATAKSKGMFGDLGYLGLDQLPQKLQGALDKVSGTAPQGFAQWLVAGGVAAAPAILAAVDGALLAGVGSVGIGAAIVGQVKDPEVSSAFKDLGHGIMADLTAASVSFKDPLIQASHEFGDAWRSILPGLRSDFEALAPAFSRLAEGFAGFVTHTMPGFNDALKASAPILEMLGAELPHLGDAMSSFFHSIAAGGEGGKKALQDVLILVESMVTWLGKVIEYGSKAFDWLDKAKQFGPVGVLLDYFADSTDHAKTSQDHLKVSTAAATAAVKAQEAAVDSLRAAYDKWFSGAMNADMAEIRLKSSEQALTDSIRQNGRAWDDNTAAGRANNTALHEAIQAAKDKYDADVKQYGNSPKFLKAYQDEVNTLLAQALAAGDSAAAVDNLRAKYGALGLTLESLPREIDIRTHFITEGTPPSQFAHGLAAGGFVPPVRAAQGLLPPRAPGTLVLAGEPETGGEVMIPQRGISRARAAALGSVAMAPYGLAVGAAAGGGGAGGASGGGGAVAHIHVHLGGKELGVFAVDLMPAMMSAAQQRKKIYGSTGLA